MDPLAPESKPGTEAELLAALPAGSRVMPIETRRVDLKTATGIGEIDGIFVDASTDLTDGIVTILRGRAPAAADEIAVSPPALERIGGRFGGTVTSADGTTTYRIVGLFEEPDNLGERLLLPPDPNPTKGNIATWLVDTPGPVTWAEVQRLNQLGIVVNSRELFLHPITDYNLLDGLPQPAPVQGLTPTVLVSGLALLEIILMAGPAFAVSARRRQRQLALVAANGGTPAHIRRIVLADGVFLGLIGAAVGIAAGLVAAVLGRPYVETHLANFRAGGYRVYPTALAGIVVLAIVTGVLAALVPAFITARQNVVSSLAGRRGITRSRKRWLALGLAGAGAGTAIVIYGTLQVSQNVILGGLIVGELGLVLCTPSLVGLIARIGRILPLAPRIALRDAARNRAAAAPAISAVMAAVAGSVALGLYFDSSAAQQRTEYRQTLPLGAVQVYLPEPMMPEQAQSSGGEPVTVMTPAEIETAVRSAVAVTGVGQVGRATCRAGVTDHWCALPVYQAPSRVCPYAAELARVHVLTKQQQRAARQDPRCQNSRYYNGQGGDAVVSDGSNLAVITGAVGDDLSAAVAMLRSGGAVVSDPELIENGKVSLGVINIDSNKGPDGDPYVTAPRHEVPGYLMTTGVVGSAIVPPSLVDSLGLGTTPAYLVAATSRMPTVAEQDHLSAMLMRGQAYAQVERGPRLEFDPRLWILIAASALITLAAAAIGTGLAAADGRADLSTLAAVGASPRVRRGLSLSQSGVIAGLGSVLGAAAGLGAAVAVLSALNFQWNDVWPGPALMPLQIPWLSLAMSLLVIPAIAMLGAGLLTRSRLPIERRE
jgi:putative ABC transport system permease protein